MAAQLFHNYHTLPVPRKAITTLVDRIYRQEHIATRKDCNLIFCSDYVIRRLNRDYRGIDRATDVLSFTFDDPDLLGEIYISLQRAAVQSRRFGLSYTEELQRLTVHGMFHLLGFDHGTPSQERAMVARERRYFDVE